MLAPHGKICPHHAKSMPQLQLHLEHQANAAEYSEQHNVHAHQTRTPDTSCDQTHQRRCCAGDFAPIFFIAALSATLASVGTRRRGRRRLARWAFCCKAAAPTAVRRRRLACARTMQEVKTRDPRTEEGGQTAAALSFPDSTINHQPRSQASQDQLHNTRGGVFAGATAATRRPSLAVLPSALDCGPRSFSTRSCVRACCFAVRSWSTTPNSWLMRSGPETFACISIHPCSMRVCRW